MYRLCLMVLIACGLAAGCGAPAPPTLDTAGEQEYERQQREANSAEGKGQPKVKKDRPAVDN